MTNAAQNRSESDSGENVRIVALSRIKRLRSQSDFVERTAAGENGATLKKIFIENLNESLKKNAHIAKFVGLFRRALGFTGRIR